MKPRGGSTMIQPTDRLIYPVAAYEGLVQS